VELWSKPRGNVRFRAEINFVTGYLFAVLQLEQSINGHDDYFDCRQYENLLYPLAQVGVYYDNEHLQFLNS
jgi:hypothetical protein